MERRSMSVIWTPNGSYSEVDFEDEADFEKTVILLKNDLFGPDRIYLDIKKKIGKAKQNIPDGYLVDLSSATPRLYVVENELSSHHPTKHIAAQLAEFAVAFDEDQINVRNILVEAVHSDSVAKQTCEAYVANQTKLNSIEDLIDKLVLEAEFAALVIIDEQSERLEAVFEKCLRFRVEVIELTRHQDSNGSRTYAFEPFLVGLDSPVPVAGGKGPGKELGRKLDVGDVDTLVVPARLAGFNEVFLGENRWYAVRIHPSMLKQIKYVAAYQVKPISAITYIAKVASIEPWGGDGKYALNFSEPAAPIGPIGLVKDGEVSAPQGIRYTSQQKLVSAKSLDDAF
jgi:hypothetical protein